MFKIFLFIQLIALIWSEKIDIDQLLNRLSNEEKCGQMTQVNFGLIEKETRDSNEIPIDPIKLKHVLAERKIGSFLVAPYNEAKKSLQAINIVQAFILNETEHKIPIIYGSDSIHGNGLIQEGVLFPQPLNQAATFNKSIAHRIGEITALETRAIGVPWNFNPVLDIGRQPLWPR